MLDDRIGIIDHLITEGPDLKISVRGRSPAEIVVHPVVFKGEPVRWLGDEVITPHVKIQLVRFPAEHIPLPVGGDIIPHGLIDAGHGIVDSNLGGEDQVVRYIAIRRHYGVDEIF